MNEEIETNISNFPDEIDIDKLAITVFPSINLIDELCSILELDKLNSYQVERKSKIKEELKRRAKEKEL